MCRNADQASVHGAIILWFVQNSRTSVVTCYLASMRMLTLIKVVALALLLVPAYLLAGQSSTVYNATVVKVIDGDTIKLDVAIWPGLTQRINLRLDGIDTPEKRGSPPCEKKLAKQATKFTAVFVVGGVVTVSGVRLGKYAGRALGRISVDGRDLVAALIKAGHVSGRACPAFERFAPHRV